MSSPVNIQELRTGIGFNKQSDLVTPLAAASIWCLRQTSRNIAMPAPGYEDDAAEIGKGDVWATQQFPTGLDVNWPWEGYLTSETAAMIAAFGLGKVSSAAAGTGFKHTCTPLDMVTDGIEMPSTTLVQQLRPGASVVLDVAFPGVCCEEFAISLKTGIGRQNATFRSVWAGVGKYVTPSTIELPALTSEHSLNAMGATKLLIATQDYITLKRFMTLDMNWKNNIRLDTGYYPGSGTQANGDGSKVWGMRGRMRRGDPTCALSFSAEFVNGSTELDTLIAGTEGTAEVTIDGATIGAGPDKHQINIKWHRVMFKAVDPGDAEGIVTAQVNCTVMKHSTNGVVTITVTNEKTGIGAAAA